MELRDEKLFILCATLNTEVDQSQDAKIKEDKKIVMTFRPPRRLIHGRLPQRSTKFL